MSNTKKTYGKICPNCGNPEPDVTIAEGTTTIRCIECNTLTNEEEV